ncbi:MAG: Rossmann-like domain-containing protein [Anaerolineae bacterium]
MSLIDELLSSLRFNAPVHDVRIGLHWTAVAVKAAEGIRAGLATVSEAQESHCEGQPCVHQAGCLLERSSRELTELIRSHSIAEASVGLATINALLDVDEASCVEVNAEDILIKEGLDKRIVIVGHFPFVPHVRQVAKELWVLERYPRGEDLPATRAEEIVPQADVVGITGSTLINHTFDYLLSLCQPGAYVLVMGGSAPLSPVFFDHGVNAVAGTLVVDVEQVLRAVSQGANFRQIPGKRLLAMFR